MSGRDGAVGVAEGYAGSQKADGAYVDGHDYHQTCLANERPGCARHSANSASLVETLRRYHQGRSDRAHSVALDFGGTCEAGRAGDHETPAVADCDTPRAFAGEELPRPPSLLEIHLLISLYTGWRFLIDCIATTCCFAANAVCEVKGPSPRSKQGRIRVGLDGGHDHRCPNNHNSNVKITE